MDNLVSEALNDPEVRRAYEEEVLVAEATDTLEAYLESTGISRKELARRLSVSPGRVTQILSGEENLTLRSLAATAWALGLRLRLDAQPANRAGTPAKNDLPAPTWLLAGEQGPG